MSVHKIDFTDFLLYEHDAILLPTQAGWTSPVLFHPHLLYFSEVGLECVSPNWVLFVIFKDWDTIALVFKLVLFESDLA